MEKDIEKLAGSRSTPQTYRKHTSKNRPLASKERPIDLSQWMSRIEDHAPLSSLTLPGTHDSCAYTSTFPFIATQTLSIRRQLAAGIRYFDFRCGLRDNVVEMCHGIRFLGLTFSSVLRVMYRFLAKHPSEALIVQIKRDRGSQRSTVDFATGVSDLISKHAERWRTANTPFTLGELRGRIQLFRRFTFPSVSPDPSNPDAEPEKIAYGIDVTSWQDNPSTPFTICTSHSTQLTIQDHYNFPFGTPLPSLIEGKGADIAELLVLAEKCKDPGHWFINFTSAFEFNLRYQIPPHPIAVGGRWWGEWVEGVNVRLRAWLWEREERREKGKGRLGIVAMDFPEQGSVDLIQALVWTNFEREDEEEGGLGLGLDVRWFAVAGLLVLLVWFLWRHFFTVFIGTWSTCSPDGLGRWSKPVGVSFAVGIRG
ncbi:hypothetical protein LTR09_000056 [Extremus antarcticus]|uniref:Phosphatidylinositol-specific phospholipase C X domain-containing protein n=1 Tax=Extremus antarcticus TaxID=702011 RepID=A0AAJ0GIX3_9PEZI|nr:hypothetical protein LTR09_000056 [Extremus antarcticus]